MPKSSRVKSAATRRRPKAKPSRPSGARPKKASARARARSASVRKRPAAPKPKASRRPARPVAADRGGASDRALRELLIAQLDGGHAHATLAQALDGFPADKRGVRPDGAAHSAWQVLEHLRLSQWDIVEFTRDPAHRSPSWPDGYWPSEEAPASESDWNASVLECERELGVMKRLLREPERPLFTQVEHPAAQAHHTLAREAIVLAVHNGYHISELIVLRRLLGAWPG